MKSIPFLDYSCPIRDEELHFMNVRDWPILCLTLDAYTNTNHLILTATL